MSGGHERWLVSYADFMTLMFAVFVMLWSTSTVDADKYRGVADALSEMSANNDKKMFKKLDAPEQQMKVLAEELLKVLKDIDKQDLVTLSFDEDKIRILLSADLAFGSGQANILGVAKPILTAIFEKLVASSFGTHPDLFMDMVGHTDNLPINSVIYPSNWELSAARAASVARFVTEDFQVSHKIRVIGYGDTAPIALNDSVAGRGKNRRVELVLLTKPSYGHNVMRDSENNTENTATEMVADRGEENNTKDKLPNTGKNKDSQQNVLNSEYMD